MNNETAGERVFGNVDEALADRIMSRARENSKGPEPAFASKDSFDDGDAGVVDTGKRRRRSGAIVGILIPVALVLIAVWVLIRRRCR